MKSLLPLAARGAAGMRRRKKSPPATVEDVAVFEPVIIPDTWRVGWYPVGPKGEVRFVIINEEGQWRSVTPPEPSAKD